MVVKILFTILLVALASSAKAQNYETGESAYKRGDYQTALKHFKPLANKGHAKAQSNLGFMYSKGYGVIRDYNMSIIWFSKAAIQNDPDAQHNLGIMHGNGLGVPRDHFLAYIWFSIAAANGHQSSNMKRELAATRLKPEEIIMAEQIFRECQKRLSFCRKYAMPGKDI